MSMFSMTDHYRRADTVMQLIYINAVVWLLSVVTGWLGFWVPVRDFLAVYSGVLPCLLHIWGLVTYMFVNQGFMVMLGYALLLFWFGHIMLTKMNGPQLVALYLFSGIVGGIAFALVADGSAVGSAAAIVGLIVATAVMDPDTEVPILFIGSVKTIWLSIIVIALFLIHNHTLPFASMLVGGAFGGWLYATLFKKGKDLSKPFTYVINHIDVMLTQKKSKADEEAGPKFHYAENVVNNSVDDVRQPQEQHNDDVSKQDGADDDDNAEIERILTKIRTSGYSSLTEDEKQRIFK